MLSVRIKTRRLPEVATKMELLLCSVSMSSSLADRPMPSKGVFSPASKTLNVIGKPQQ